MIPDLLSLIRVLSAAGVDYIIVGGVAANLRFVPLDFVIRSRSGCWTRFFTPRHH